MDQIQLKVGREILILNENDIVMDNGACIQIITRYTGRGAEIYPVKMSKKLFSELKRVEYLYTNTELAERAREKYNSRVTLYKFNISAMCKYKEYQVG